MKSANRLRQIAPFKVMELLARANDLQAAGKDVIHLEVGEPDFETPAPILEAAIRGLAEGATRYTDARGLPALREQISLHYREQSVEVDPVRIFVTAGASGGLLLLTNLLLNAGDNLLMSDPGYPCNRHFLAAVDAEGLLVPTVAEDNYQLTPSLVDANWTDRTRGVLTASPANPTGAVLARGELAALVGCVMQHDGLFISDEIYQGLTYDNIAAVSALAVHPDAIAINSFSKYFGMTGWRLGWIVVPHELAPDLEKLAQNLFICPSSIAQVAALAAFSDESKAVMESQRQQLENRRDYLVPALRDLGFDIAINPAGAFYVYAGLPEGCEDAETFCSRLLEEEFVAITPGTDFGHHNAVNHVRISYARDIARLVEAVERIGRMLR